MLAPKGKTRPILRLKKGAKEADKAASREAEYQRRKDQTIKGEKS